MTALRLSLLLLAPAALLAAPQPDPHRFDLIPSDYKRPQVLPGTFFNPFKIQAVADGGVRADPAAVSNEAVAAALGHRGLSGLVYGRSAGQNRAIIGDDVFGVGDEIAFSGDNGEAAPLVAGASVVLRAVAADHLTLEVTPAGEASRTLNYPLRAFWRP